MGRGEGENLLKLDLISMQKGCQAEAGTLLRWGRAGGPHIAALRPEEARRGTESGLIPRSIKAPLNAALKSSIQRHNLWRRLQPVGPHRLPFSHKALRLQGIAYSTSGIPGQRFFPTGGPGGKFQNNRSARYWWRWPPPVQKRPIRPSKPTK